MIETDNYFFSYATDPNMISSNAYRGGENVLPISGAYLIHSGLNVPGDFSFSLKFQRVGEQMGTFGSETRFGLMKSGLQYDSDDWIACFQITDDNKDYPTLTHLGLNAYTNNGSILDSYHWVDIGDTNWHTLELRKIAPRLYFYVDNELQGYRDIGNMNYTLISSMKIRAWPNSYMRFDNDEWDETNLNMHFKIRRNDSAMYHEFRFSGLDINNLDTGLGSLIISYFPSENSLGIINCWCTRWDEDNYNVVVETFLESSNRNALFNCLSPGSVREFYNILGTPKYIDTTYDSSNTLIIEPRPDYNLSGIRRKRTVAVKNISDTFINKDTFNVKIEGIRLDIEE